MLTTVLLTEKALTSHDVQRIAHLHDPDPVHVYVVVPGHDDRSEVAEAIDDFARADFSEMLHEHDAGLSAEQLATAAGRELASSIDALKAEGLAKVDGEVAAGDPVERVVAVVSDLDADEVVVLTEPHLLADMTRRDWATRLRRVVALPVLHVVLGTDQVVG